MVQDEFAYNVLDLSQINLIYGPNSSGKSSIFRALQFVAANICQMEIPDHRQWQFNTENCHLSDFASTVTDHVADQLMVFQLVNRTFDSIHPTRLKQFIAHAFHGSVFPNEDLVSSLQSSSNSAIQVSWDCHIEMTLDDPGVLQTITFSIRNFTISGNLIEEDFLNLSFASIHSEDGDYFWVYKPDTDLLRSKEIPLHPKRLLAFVNNFLLYEFEYGIESSISDNLLLSRLLELPDEQLVSLGMKIQTYSHSKGLRLWSPQDEFGESGILANALNAMCRGVWGTVTQSLRNLVHVPALREVPKEILSTESSYLNKYFGGVLSGKVQLEETRKIDPFQFLRKSRDFHQDIQIARDWFKQLCEGKFDFEIEPVKSSMGTTLAMRLSVKSGESVSSFENVGSGLSQILPVVLALHTTGNALTFIEQPELHLHPRMQSAMADVLLDAASNAPKKQFMIETHSENLLLRVLRRVRETHFGIGERNLYPESLSVFQITSDASGSKVNKIEILDTGELPDGWSNGFVETRMDDLL